MNTNPTNTTHPTHPTNTTHPTHSTISKDTTLENIEHVMRDLEQKTNPKSIEDGLQRLSIAIENNDNSSILEPMKASAKEFEERVGRPMTYSEMRQMWG